MVGKLLILSAPSGAGKTSLSRALIGSVENTQMSISHTTRACRKGEQHGADYFFIEQIEFEKMIEQNLFLEYAKVYDFYYGTSRQNVNEMLEKGMNVLLDVDWQGARQVKKLMPESISVSILPPSRQALEERLSTRGRDSKEIIAKRMQLAESEMSHCKEADHIILNDDFNLALQDLTNIIYNRTDEIRELTIDIDQLIQPSNTV